MHRSVRIVGLSMLAASVIAGVVLVAEALIAANRSYLTEAKFEVDLTTRGCTPPLRMAVLGDSLVAGVGASSERASLPAQIARKIAEATDRSVLVEGFGVTGAVTDDVVDTQLEMIEEGSFDIIVIEVGSNDVTHVTSLGDVERGTRAMLERARELAPIVVLGSAGKLNSENFLQPLRQVVMWRATAVRERQDRVASDLDVPFIDVARDVSPAYDRTPGASSKDAFHPSDIGYEIWARPLADAVIDELEQAGGVDGDCDV